MNGLRRDVLGSARARLVEGRLSDNDDRFGDRRQRHLELEGPLFAEGDVDVLFFLNPETAQRRRHRVRAPDANVRNLIPAVRASHGFVLRGGRLVDADDSGIAISSSGAATTIPVGDIRAISVQRRATRSWAIAGAAIGAVIGAVNSLPRKESLPRVRIT